MRSLVSVAVLLLVPASSVFGAGACPSGNCQSQTVMVPRTVMEPVTVMQPRTVYEPRTVRPVLMPTILRRPLFPRLFFRRNIQAYVPGYVLE